MIPILLQLSPPDRLEAVQRYLNREGSVRGLVLTLLGFAAFGILVLILHRLHRRTRAGDVDRPRRLFRKLIPRLGVSVPQRGLLLRITSDLRLQNPTVLLLGRRVFEARVQEWLAVAAPSGPQIERRLADLADALFPGDHGDGTSTSSGVLSTPATDA